MNKAVPIASGKIDIKSISDVKSLEEVIGQVERRLENEDIEGLSGIVEEIQEKVAQFHLVDDKLLTTVLRMRKRVAELGKSAPQDSFKPIEANIEGFFIHIRRYYIAGTERKYVVEISGGIHELGPWAYRVLKWIIESYPEPYKIQKTQIDHIRELQNKVFPRWSLLLENWKECRIVPLGFKEPIKRPTGQTTKEQILPLPHKKRIASRDYSAAPVNNTPRRHPTPEIELQSSFDCIIQTTPLNIRYETTTQPQCFQYVFSYWFDDENKTLELSSSEHRLFQKILSWERFGLIRHEKETFYYLCLKIEDQTPFSIESNSGKHTFILKSQKKLPQSAKEEQGKQVAQSDNWGRISLVSIRSQDLAEQILKSHSYEV